MDQVAGVNEAVIVYLVFWLLVAWFSAYAKHTRETAVLVEHKLAPELPRGISLHLRAPWYARFGAVENVLVLAVLGYGLALLAWFWILIGFGLFLFILLPFAERYLTPHPGAWHYINVLRRRLQIRLAQSEEAGNREQAQIYRIALQRVDQGL